MVNPLLRKIKTTKYLRLDELIKYCIENNIENETFSIEKNIVSSDEDVLLSSSPSLRTFRAGSSFGNSFKMTGCVNSNDLFPVEVEEEITKDTRFHALVATYENGRVELYSDHSIYEITEYNKSFGLEVKSIYASFNGNLKLVWERRED